MYVCNNNIHIQLRIYFTMNSINSGTHKNWHVIYTRSRAEKKVAEELTNKGIENFLPIQKQLRKWKDRKKWVEVPLISGYCFVRISRKEYDEVLQTNHVVCYVTFNGKAATVPEKQMQDLKRLTEQNDVEVNVTHENFEPGQKVEIIAGPMMGIRGELVEARGKQKFILRFEQISSIFHIEISADHLSRI